ncbi:MAG TPA: hypothetical protein VH684_23575 [Xanthobacteraceae bacterium]|jgi:hypothetical protein
MSEHTLRPAADRIVISEAVIPWLVAAGIYVLLITLGGRLLADPDSYSHIALGRWILEHHAVPTGDPFSQTMQGAHWIAFEWLSQVAYAMAFKLGGWIAVVALAAAAAAAAFAQLARLLLREWQPVPTIIALLAALVLLSPHILARPHLLALPLMVTWVGSLISADDESRAPSWWLLPLMTLWANLHGSFTFGLAITAPIACEAIWKAQKPDRWQVAKRWASFAVLAVAAACLNPYGPEMILVTGRAAALGESLSAIIEWQPQDFSRFGAFELILLGGLGFALYRGVRLPPVRIVMLLGILHLGLAQSRHADLVGLLVPLFLARPLATQFGALAAVRGGAQARAQFVPAAAIGLLLPLIAFTGLIARNGVMPAANITPASALRSIDVDAGPIFNDYNFGGYFDFMGLRPFIDGRTELYGAAFTLRYERALSLVDLPDFLRMLDEYHFQTTLLVPNRPAAALMDRLPDWQRVYADNVAVVHVRRAERRAQ